MVTRPANRHHSFGLHNLACFEWSNPPDAYDHFNYDVSYNGASQGQAVMDISLAAGWTTHRVWTKLQGFGDYDFIVRGATSGGAAGWTIPVQVQLGEVGPPDPSWPVVTGSINQRWHELGAWQGPLGKPLSAETVEADGSHRQTFEHGRWLPLRRHSSRHGHRCLPTRPTRRSQLGTLQHKLQRVQPQGHRRCALGPHTCGKPRIVRVGHPIRRSGPSRAIPNRYFVINLGQSFRRIGGISIRRNTRRGLHHRSHTRVVQLEYGNCAGAVCLFSSFPKVTVQVALGDREVPTDPKSNLALQLANPALGGTPAQAYASHYARADDIARHYARTRALVLPLQAGTEDAALVLIAHLHAVSQDPDFTVAGELPSEVLIHTALKSIDLGRVGAHR